MAPTITTPSSLRDDHHALGLTSRIYKLLFQIVVAIHVFMDRLVSISTLSLLDDIAPVAWAQVVGRRLRRNRAEFRKHKSGLV